MKYLLQVLATLLLSLPVFAADDPDSYQYRGVKPQVVIDVRTAEEFAAGHVAGAVNIPFDQIGQRIHGLKTLRKDSPILLYCRSGRRSALAEQTLRQQGYTRVIDGGGLEEVKAELKPCSGAC